MDETAKSKNELSCLRREGVGQILRFGLDSLTARPGTDKEWRIFLCKLSALIRSMLFIIADIY